MRRLTDGSNKAAARIAPAPHFRRDDGATAAALVPKSKRNGTKMDDKFHTDVVRRGTVEL